MLRGGRRGAGWGGPGASALVIIGMLLGGG